MARKGLNNTKVQKRCRFTEHLKKILMKEYISQDNTSVFLLLKTLNLKVKSQRKICFWLKPRIKTFTSKTWVFLTFNLMIKAVLTICVIIYTFINTVNVRYLELSRDLARENPYFHIFYAVKLERNFRLNFCFLGNWFHIPPKSFLTHIRTMIASTNAQMCCAWDFVNICIHVIARIQQIYASTYTSCILISSSLI